MGACIDAPSLYNGYEGHILPTVAGLAGEAFEQNIHSRCASDVLNIAPKKCAPLPQSYRLVQMFMDIEPCAAGIGSLAGAVLAMLERKPVMPHMAGTAASAAICLSVYGGKSLATLP